MCAFHGLTGDSYVLVVLRPLGGQQTICTAYTNDGNPGNDTCTYIPPN